MFRQSEQGRRRVNAQPSARIRGVEVARGRTGYGFTLSGQSPCVLNCILKGSPADYVGLRSGDQILSVNDINVSKASHEDVVKLIGRCTGVLYLVIAEGSHNNAHLDSCSSDEELGFHDHKSHWLRPKMDSKTLGINRAERVVAEMQSGGIFNMIFENSSHSSSSSEKAVACASASKTRAFSEPDFSYGNAGTRQSDPNLLTEEEMAKVLNDDSVFVDVFEQQDEFALLQNADSAGILNVGMVVGYLGSIELASTSANLESDSLQAIRGCMRRLRAEQKVHSLVLLKVMHDCVQLCNDRGAVLATYPAEKLAFSAVCPDDRRFFGLVTMQATNAHAINRHGEEEQGLRTSCHVFIVDPELCHHKIHQGVARRFGFDCTPDPDTSGCLEFPPTSQPLLQFVSVLYRDMGESIEGMRARAFLDGDLDAQQNNSTSSNSDSGIGNFLPEEKSNRVLLVDLGANPSRHVPTGLWENPPGPRSQSVLGGLPPPPPPPPPVSHRNGYRPDQFVDHPQPHPHSHGDPPLLSSRHLNSSSRLDVSGLPSRSHYSAHGKKVTGASGQRWLPVHVLRDWRQGHSSDQESYAESTDGWSSANCSTLPPPMSKIPADRYRAAGEIASQPHRLHARKDEWAKKLFGEKSLREHQQQSNDCRRMKDSEKKGRKFKGITMGFPQRSSGRRSFGRSKRLSMARSLDDLESAAVSDGELNSVDLKGCGSDNSLNSNASLPSVQCHRRHTERRIASWAVCFERLLQDPVGVRYFSEFLKKEFSEENILFWQACEYFSHVPETDKKQLSQKAREIYNSFLSSKATTPVNIDSQAQLADDILNAPRPDMFKEQQLQIFNLMKFDSYTRFLKSYLYQECMLAEVEGRPLPDPYQVPSSPTSKHSTSSDRSNLSTPKKMQDDKKSKSGRSLNEDSRDEHSDKKKSIFFSWSRNRSFGKGSKKKDLGDYSFTGSNGRRESQGSLSSGASLELATSGSGKNEGEVSRNSMSLSERAVRHCNIYLPDGSCCPVHIRPGISIREVLLGLCEKLSINLAAVDLFLVGGEKPLVLDQDCMTLCSRDLRLEKRTLFRLDLVPINRSVGLKAKPTKPVTEVLRPVVAKYGLNLGDLVARISGEKEPLDLGLPISNLDGLRVVLEAGDHVPGKEKAVLIHAPLMCPILIVATQGEDKAAGKASAVKTRAQVEKRKQKKLNIDEAEEFFELISKAQSNRADDQRGLLNKSNLVLPDFLRLDTEADSNNLSSTPVSHKNRPRSKENGSTLSASHQSQSLDSAVEGTAPRRALMPPNSALRNAAGRNPPPFSSSLSPIPHSQKGGSSGITDWRSDGGVQALEEEESSTDLTFVAEGDITSPNSSLLHQSPMPLPSSPDRLHLLREDTFQDSWARSERLIADTGFTNKNRFCSVKNERRQRERTSVSKYSHRRAPSAPPPAPPPPPPRVRGGSKRAPLHVRGVLDVDGIRCDDLGGRNGELGGLERVVGDLKTSKGRMRTGVYQTSDQAELLPVKKCVDPTTKTAIKPSVKTSSKKNNHSKNNATFV
uniref:Regulator of G-protein signaling 12-like n=1 Tax=Sinocyclocheilus anshuiensis TaxID=1608454 RepID=A0A671RTU1_9TELE